MGETATAVTHPSIVQEDSWRTWPMKQRAYRMKVVQCFLRDGIPLSKVTGLRDLLEEHAYRLASRGHLSEYIPIVHDEECNSAQGDTRATGGFSF